MLTKISSQSVTHRSQSLAMLSQLIINFTNLSEHGEIVRHWGWLELSKMRIDKYVIVK